MQVLMLATTDGGKMAGGKSETGSKSVFNLYKVSWLEDTS